MNKIKTQKLFNIAIVSTATAVGLTLVSVMITSIAENVPFGPYRTLGWFMLGFGVVGAISNLASVIMLKGWKKRLAALLMLVVCVLLSAWGAFAATFSMS